MVLHRNCTVQHSTLLDNLADLWHSQAMTSATRNRESLPASVLFTCRNYRSSPELRREQRANMLQTNDLAVWHSGCNVFAVPQTTATRNAAIGLRLAAVHTANTRRRQGCGNSRAGQESSTLTVPTVHPSLIADKLGPTAKTLVNPPARETAVVWCLVGTQDDEQGLPYRRLYGIGPESSVELLFDDYCGLYPDVEFSLVRGEDYVG